jgi:hypothetical protein
MADLKVDVPSASARQAARSSHRTRGTIGMHAKRGSRRANGSADGLVEIEIDPPCRTARSPQHFVERVTSAGATITALLAFLSGYYRHHGKWGG